MTMTFRYSSFFFAGILFLLTSCAQKSGNQSNSTPSGENKTKSVAYVVPEQSEPDTVKGSIPSEATGKIGTANVCIRYTSPAVRGRGIWGELVPYNKVWVTGAHNATSIETDQPITIGGTKIPAGRYAFFTIPGTKEWTVIINKNWQQHQADKYSQAEDLVRLTVTPQTVQKHQERLRYDVAGEGNSGNIVMSWEKIRLNVPVER